MTTINPQAMDTLSQATGLTAEQSALGQEQFLKLMMTQLQNQDPTAYGERGLSRSAGAVRNR